MLTPILNLVFILCLAYILFLEPMPDEETLQEEGYDQDRFARDTVFNIAFCIIGLAIVNLFDLINCFVG